MAARTRLWLALVLVVAGFAGCVGGTAGVDADGSNGGPDPSAVVGEGRSAINVVVTDDSLEPLAGVDVGIKETKSAVTTDATGGAHFVGVEPGKYTLLAQRLGYESAARAVTVEDAALDVRMQLVPLAIVEAYHNTLFFKGFMTCGVGLVVVAGTLCGTIPTAAGNVTIDPNNKVFFDQAGVSALKDVIAEMAWTPSAALAASQLQIYLWQNHRCTPVCNPEYSYGGAQGKSPVVLRSEGPFAGLKKGPATITHTVWTPFQSAGPPYVELVLQQPFNLYSTHFFGAPAPEVFTALPDS